MMVATGRTDQAPSSEHILASGPVQGEAAREARNSSTGTRELFNRSWTTDGTGCSHRRPTWPPFKSNIADRHCAADDKLIINGSVINYKWLRMRSMQLGRALM